jgi:hypothetical protein
MFPQVEGTVALVGSGEFTAAVAPLDRHLLGPGSLVLALTTASAPDGARVQRRWAAMAEAHFAGFGVDVRAPLVCCDDCALEPHVAEAIEAADLIWFSGGDPRWLRDSIVPVEHAIRDALRRGARVAGASAGAMALGGYTLAKEWAEPDWEPALGLVPGIGVLPHFDRLDPARIAEAVDAAPRGLVVVGIDEDTALVLGDGESRVVGPGRVVVFADGERIVLRDPAPETLAV